MTNQNKTPVWWHYIPISSLFANALTTENLAKLASTMVNTKENQKQIYEEFAKISRGLYFYAIMACFTSVIPCKMSLGYRPWLVFTHFTYYALLT